MTALDIIIHGDGCWPDLTEKKAKEATHIAIAALPAGTQAGKPSVTIRMDFADGSTVIGQTTLALLVTVVGAFVAAHGDPRGY